MRGQSQSRRLQVERLRPRAAMPISSGVLLAVDVGHLVERLGPLPPSVSLVLAHSTALTPDMLERTDPAAIVAPLMAAPLDIIDLAKWLNKHDYRGRLIAVSEPLPDRRIVESDVRAECPGLDFSVYEVL